MWENLAKSCTICKNKIHPREKSCSIHKKGRNCMMIPSSEKVNGAGAKVHVKSRRSFSRKRTAVNQLLKLDCSKD